MIYDSPEANWNEYGTDPHMPPEEPIIGWGRRNASLFRISSRSKSAVKKVANSIRWKIVRHGTDPSPFLRPAFDDYRQEQRLLCGNISDEKSKVYSLEYKKHQSHLYPCSRGIISSTYTMSSSIEKTAL